MPGAKQSSEVDETLKASYNLDTNAGVCYTFRRKLAVD